MYLAETRPEPGSWLGTESGLVAKLDISRSTVRRALGPLEAAGWIDRRAGAGTFAGPRIGQGEVEGVDRTFADRSLEPHLTALSGPRGAARSQVRLAVLIFNIGDLARDWYTPLVMEGLDEAAAEAGVTIELVGGRDHDDVDAISRRLAACRPDALACLASDPWVPLVLRDAQRMGIRCFVTGTPHAGLGVPAIAEDNRQIIRLAVDHLMGQGHREIGLVLQRSAEPWVMERHEAFTEALEAAGVQEPERRVLWLPMNRPDHDQPWVDRLEAFIRERELTGLVPGNYLAMRYLDTLVRSARLRVPRDLSVVNLEQDWSQRRRLGTRQPTTVEFPLRDIGRVLARMCREAFENESESPSRTVLPARLLPGDTVSVCQESQQIQQTPPVQESPGVLPRRVAADTSPNRVVEKHGKSVAPHSSKRRL
jgi:DNA-binding LacI/PurR family transcriptional regulator